MAGYSAPRYVHPIRLWFDTQGDFAGRLPSVSRVARRHNVNPNQVFAWRQQYRQGLLDSSAAEGGNPMLPVKVGTPTVLPTERVRRVARESREAELDLVGIEIKLANGHSIVVRGQVDAKVLARVIDVLVRR